MNVHRRPVRLLASHTLVALSSSTPTLFLWLSCFHGKAVLFLLHCSWEDHSPSLSDRLKCSPPSLLSCKWFANSILSFFEVSLFLYTLLGLKRSALMAFFFLQGKCYLLPGSSALAFYLPAAVTDWRLSHLSLV